MDHHRTGYRMAEVSAVEDAQFALPDSRIAAAELGVRYLVEGSLRKEGVRLRVAGQLVDAHSGRCLWAAPYELADAGLFELQDTIAQQGAGAIEPELFKNIGSPATRRRGPGVSSWDVARRVRDTLARTEWYAQTRRRMVEEGTIEAGGMEALGG